MEERMSTPLLFRKRGFIVTLYDVLTTCQDGPVRKTHIMYRAKLSYRQLQLYLQVALNKGLCEEVALDGDVYYRITAKGRDFLRKFRDITQLLREGIDVSSTEGA
jgi:predicted transcriptional regulator